MSDWQPIIYAPKDGSEVELGWIIDDKLEWQDKARWTDDGWNHRLSGCCIDPTHWRMDDR